MNLTELWSNWCSGFTDPESIADFGADILKLMEYHRHQSGGNCALHLTRTQA